VFKNVGSNWVVSLVTMVAIYFLTPFTIHKLGDDAYGTWNLINALTGYLGLLALGVPMASVRYFAEHVASGDSRKLNETIGSCTALYLALGAIALVVGIGLYVFFAHAYHIPAALHGDARIAFALVVLFVSLGFVGLLPNGILSAHDDFVPRNMVRLWGVVLRLVLTFVLLALQASLTMLALVQLVCLIFDFAFCWLIIRRRYPETRLRLADLNWGMARSIFSFSLYVLVLTAGIRLSFETDSIVIGAFENVRSIPYFTVANSFVIYFMEFILAIAAVVMPAATRLKTRGQHGELREVLLKWSKIAFSVTLVIGLFLIVLGPRFIAWWIDPSFERPAGQVLQILMISNLVFLPVRGVALPILMGLGKPGLPTVGFLVAGLVNLGLSIALVGPLGIAGVALGTAIPNVLFAGLVLWQACREVDTPLLGCLRYVFGRAIVGGIPVLALLLWFKFGLDVRGLSGLGAAGLAMTAVVGVTWLLLVYRHDPYIDLRARLPVFKKALSRA
jgi:O-antigen/teichoic acid export membrane protein